MKKVLGLLTKLFRFSAAIFLLIPFLFSCAQNPQGKSPPERLYDAWQVLEQAEAGGAECEDAIAGFSDALLQVKQSGAYKISYYVRDAKHHDSYKAFGTSVDAVDRALQTFLQSPKSADDFQMLKNTLGGKMADFAFTYAQNQAEANSTLTMLLVLLAALMIALAACLVAYRYSERRVRAQKKQSDEFASAVLRGQESERQHLSREIHDTVLQDLNARHLLAENAAEELNRLGEKEAAEAVHKIGGMSRSSSRRLRSICQNLTPPELDDGLLFEAVSTLCGNFARDRRIRCIYTCGEEARRTLNSLDEQAKRNVYRIIQESLTNAAVHGKADEVAVTIRPASPSGGNRLVLFITDDGSGFDTRQNTAQTGPHFGIRGMRCRAEQQLGGKLVIKSEVGEGTTVRVEFG